MIRKAVVHLLTFLAAAAPLAPAFAGGQTPQAGDWTVTAQVGASRLSEPSVRFTPSAGSATDGEFRMGGGQLSGAALGRYLTPNLRLEAEFMYRSNSIDGSTVPGLALAGTDGDYASTILMANVVREFEGWRTGFASFRPYVGVGIGLATEIDSDLPVAGVEQEFSARDQFAWQVMAGVNWFYDSGWFAGAGVRWLDAGRVTLESGAGGARVEADYGGLSALVRVGYRF